MPDLCSINHVRDLLARHGLRPNKALGQNFLVNPSVCPRMAELGGAGPGVGALEIGPGVGVLTEQLALRCDKVVAVELDGGLLPVLAETLQGRGNVELVHGDVLKLDLPALLAERFGALPVVVCANLPYYITTPILMALLEKKLPLRSITVMMQKETARRICAPVPSREAGAVTAAVRWRSEPELLFAVSAGSFYPPPDVDSAVVRLTPRAEPPAAVCDEALFFRVIRGAFSQRRKTLLNSLSSALGRDKASLSELLRAAEVDPGARAEALTLEAFARIANMLEPS